MIRAGLRLLAGAAVALAWSTGASHGQPQTTPPPALTAMRQAGQAQGRGEYLAAVSALEDAVCSGAIVPDGPEWSFLAQMRPMLNGYDPPPQVRSGSRALTAEERARLDGVSLRPAIGEIRRAAADARIVILNEAHHSPRDRAFGLEVARALRPLGYTVLAAEAFTNAGGAEMWEAMTGLATTGYPRRGAGTYLIDPVFADFVRQSLALGYRPVAYEQTNEQRTPGGGIEQREQAQAENLAAALTRYPGAKFLIYVGFSHVTEAPIDRYGIRTEWMAARLKRMTGLDPVTIDQTSVTEIADERYLREAYDLLVPRTDRSAVFFRRNAPWSIGHYGGAIDFQVIHPRQQLAAGRPTWLRLMGRRLRPIPTGLLPTRGRRLIQAFLRDETDGAIPVEQVVVEAGRPIPGLMLPDRPVRFAIQEGRVPTC